LAAMQSLDFPINIENEMIKIGTALQAAEIKIKYITDY
jgi:hypothetical protein